MLTYLTSSEDELKQKWPIWRELLQNGQIQQIINLALQVLPCYHQTDRGNHIEREINYFLENIKRMQYDLFKQKGLFVGSGVIEAGCKTIIGKRLKQSGMFWSLKGANASLLCVAMRSLTALMTIGKIELVNHTGSYFYVVHPVFFEQHD